MTVTITGLTKRYGATLALDAVDLEIRSGEVHALLGHNGAGKSTVIACLGGRTSPTQGVMTIDGTAYEALDPRSSIAAGVAVIYQHLSVIDSLTITENLFLGQELAIGGTLLRRSEQRRIAFASLQKVGVSADPDTLVGALSMGQRQMVEIAKALQRNARLLILDEPSAALSPVESQRLSGLVQQLKGQGLAILYVTHLLSEVERLADRATVLSGGRAVWSSEAGAPLTKRELVEAISGGRHDGRVAAPEPDTAGPPVLELRGFGAEGRPAVDLAVRPGEIIALYGLIGSGRTRLLESVFGRRRSTGAVLVDGARVNTGRPDRALRAGIALVPGDRQRQGLFHSLSAAENLLTRAMTLLARGPFRNIPRERVLVADALGAMRVRPPRAELPAAQFSGGNQQKILIGRWVNPASPVRVLLLDDPTQGVDIGARAEIYEVIRELVTARRIAVVYATNEPDEVLALAHRCLVLRDGAVVQEIDAGRSDEEELLDLIHSEHARA